MKPLHISIGIAVAEFIIILVLLFSGKRQSKSDDLPFDSTYWNNTLENMVLSSDSAQLIDIPMTGSDIMFYSVEKNNANTMDIRDQLNRDINGLMILDQAEFGSCAKPEAAELKDYVKVVVDLTTTEASRVIYSDINGLAYTHRQCMGNDAKKKSYTTYLPHQDLTKIEFFTVMRSTKTFKNPFSFSLKVYHQNGSLLSKYPADQEALKDTLKGIKHYNIKATLVLPDTLGAIARN